MRSRSPVAGGGTRGALTARHLARESTATPAGAGAREARRRRARRYTLVRFPLSKFDSTRLRVLRRPRSCVGARAPRERDGAVRASPTSPPVFASPLNTSRDID
ncbi:hypothetical protein EVAR_39489_1 [Eumeta japonica]|uniref:Uncharacterized protein n=1 Tax=Eumeta variegata TaxID=151549 RepID=A0A4C1W0U9_EUMVA|nr:hypothetical protein EVAR_39489_1 [Eumeta japonica]